MPQPGSPLLKAPDVIPGLYVFTLHHCVGVVYTLFYLQQLIITATCIELTVYTAKCIELCKAVTYTAKK